MSLLASFIAALERTGGERLVLKSGEPPHLLVGATRRDLGTATVSNKALAALTAQILSPDGQRIFAETNTLDEPLTLAGAVSSSSLFVEARRSGNDTSITLRRIAPEPAAAVVKPAPAAAVVEPAPPSVPLPPAPAEPVAAPAAPANNVTEPDAWEPIDLAAPALKVAAVAELKPAPADQPVAIAIPEPLPEPAAVSPMAVAISTVAVVEPLPEPAAVSAAALPAPAAAPTPAAVPIDLVAIPEPLPEPAAVALTEEPNGLAAVPEPLPEPAAVAPAAGSIRIVAFPQQEPKAAAVDAVPAKIVPACRPDTSALDYWIRQAARRDATALYLRGGQAPVMRVREQVEQLTGDPLDDSAVDGVAAAFAANDEAWRAASDGEWVREYDGIGEVRCQVFTDEIGLGLVVHLSAQHSASTLQKSIPRLVRRACEEEDGIVLVSAEAAADVLAMVAAVAQWTAERRAGYLISVEPPNGLGHDITGTFVSARRVDGPPEDVAAAIRRAAQQRPDILVIALPSGIAAEEAIRAARPGCLMILGVVAPTAPRALESLLSLVNPQVEPQMRRSLAAGLRCGFSYRALRRIGGGRTIVHDALIATREVRAGLDRWDFGALDKLQRSGAGGMRSLDAALAGAVHRREISLRQAAIHAVDCGELVSLVRQASRERVRKSREERPGGLRAVAGTSGTQPL